MKLTELKSWDAALKCESHCAVSVFFNEVRENISNFTASEAEELVMAIIFLTLNVEPDKIHRVTRAARNLPFKI